MFGRSGGDLSRKAFVTAGALLLSFASFSSSVNADSPPQGVNPNPVPNVAGRVRSHQHQRFGPDHILKLFDEVASSSSSTKAKDLMDLLNRDGLGRKARLVLKGEYVNLGTKAKAFDQQWVEYVPSTDVFILDPSRGRIKTFNKSELYKPLRASKSLRNIKSYARENPVGGLILKILEQAIPVKYVRDNHSVDSAPFRPSGSVDYFQTPCETKRFKCGDCEDQTFFLVDELVDRGIDAKWEYGKLTSDSSSFHIYGKVRPRPGVMYLLEATEPALIRSSNKKSDWYVDYSLSSYAPLNDFKLRLSQKSFDNLFRGQSQVREKKDFTGDGIPDVLFTNADGWQSFYVGKGNNAFSSTVVGIRDGKKFFRSSDDNILYVQDGQFFLPRTPPPTPRPFFGFRIFR